MAEKTKLMELLSKNVTRYAIDYHKSGAFICAKTLKETLIKALPRSGRARKNNEVSRMLSC